MLLSTCLQLIEIFNRFLNHIGSSLQSSNLEGASVSSPRQMHRPGFNQRQVTLPDRGRISMLLRTLEQ